MAFGITQERIREVRPAVAVVAGFRVSWCGSRESAERFAQMDHSFCFMTRR